MMTSIDCDKLCIYHVTLREPQKSYTKRYTQNTIDKEKWNSKMCSSNPFEGRKKKTEMKKQRE